MEEAAVSPLFSDALNFLALGLSVVLLFAVAYLWSSNNAKAAELERIQKDLSCMKKSLGNLEVKVSQIREPKVISAVPQIEPFGIELPDTDHMRMTPLEPQNPWMNFIDEYNDLAEEMSKPGQLRKCERFMNDNKLKILTYGGSMTFRPAIDTKDSTYWAFKISADEYAVVPNPMKPCDEEHLESGGLDEIFKHDYEDGIYRKYIVKSPAIFTHDNLRGWQLKNTGTLNLERK